LGVLGIYLIFDRAEDEGPLNKNISKWGNINEN